MADIEMMTQSAVEMAIVELAMIGMSDADCVDCSDSEIAEIDTCEEEAAEVALSEADRCFGLGLNYSAGAGVPVDLIEAHKWFNIAAMRGHSDAAQLRREIAEQMSDSDIGTAQRAARDWLKANPQAPAPMADIRIAA